MKGLRLGIAALALAAQAWAPAKADDAAARHTEQILKRLVHGERAAPAKAAVVRSAMIRLVGKVRKEGSFTPGMKCFINFGYFDGVHEFEETKGGDVVFQDGEGVCDVRVPFRWDVADDSSEIEVFFTVTNDPNIFSEVTKAPVPGLIIRSSGFSGPSIPLPAEGETVIVRFNTIM